MKPATPALLTFVIFCAGCATSYIPPTQAPPPMWSGESGWKDDPASLRVNQGKLRLGDLLAEHDVQLARTGILKESVHIEASSGGDLRIPAGTKAFAVNLTIVTGPNREPQRIDPVEWCFYLPRGRYGRSPSGETICAFWVGPGRVHYLRATVRDGFIFQPSISKLQGWPGSEPSIEQRPVDFGVQFKVKTHITGLTQQAVTVQPTYSDGTHFKKSTVMPYEWDASGRSTGVSVLDRRLTLTLLPDGASVQVKQNANGVITAGTVLIDLLIGVDGGVKQARVAKSSGWPQLDEKALSEAKTNWQLQPALENGEPVERWKRVSLTLQIEE